MKNSIYLRRKTKVIVDSGKDTASLEHLATLLKNIESLGYTLSSELLERVSTLSLKELTSFYNQIVEDLKVMVGDHVDYDPMYPNFPQQVMDMDESELYLNAMIHYFGDLIGTRLMPHSVKEKREELQDDIKLKVIKLGDRDEFKSIFTNLVSSNTSLSETDKKDIEWFIRIYRDKALLIMPDNIPLRENIAIMAGLFSKYEMDSAIVISKYMKTATDVLRFAVHLSGGDVSLAEKTKFKKFKRSERRILLNALESCKNITDDMIKYKERWKRLAGKLHPFENKLKYKNSCKSFSVILNKEKHETFAAKVEKSIINFEIDKAVELLKNRPGEYARRLDNMIRVSDNPKNVVDEFKEVSKKVSTPVLLQVKAHFSKRHESNKNKVRTFFPKGNVGKIQAIDNTLQRINPKHCDNIVSYCEDALKERFSHEKELGKVYLDSKISGFTIPFAQRSSSKSMRVVPRGSRYDIPEGDTVRFFIHWEDTEDGRVDIDLSAIGLDEDHNRVMQISYTNLKDVGGHHSGDITSAPDGAAEFIDVSVEKCLKNKVRYIMMSVFSYTGQPLSDVPDCFAGAMVRQRPNSGEIFEPKTVENRIDLTANTRICIPMIIDLKERKIIWTDLAMKRNLNHYNNLHGNMSSLQVTAKAMTELNKPNLYDLFRMHAEARGELVDTIEEADTVFSLEEGITPFDTDVIVSEYIK